MLYKFIDLEPGKVSVKGLLRNDKTDACISFKVANEKGESGTKYV